MNFNFLIVDDSSIVRSVIKKTLTLSLGDVVNLFEAKNGIEGLEMLKTHPMDMIFIDINMPIMSGMEMIEKIKSEKEFKNVPIVVVSTEGCEKRIQKLLKLGVSDFLRKPFAPEQLHKVMTKHLGS